MVGCLVVGVMWKCVLGWFGNHFGCRPGGGLWFSSLFVPSRVGFRAGNMVDALFGFSASLQPNQNAYTKVIQSKAAEFRPHICMSSTNMLGGIYTPNLCYIMTIMSLPARNILRIFQAVGHFIQVGVYKLSTLSDS